MNTTTTTVNSQSTDTAAIEQDVAALRAFSRFYTRVLGVLDDGLLDTPYSLTEARVLYELAQRDGTETVELRRAVGIDAGYLSRLLSRFSADGLITRERSPDDGRRQVIRLTASGRTAFQVLDRRSADQVAELLGTLDLDERRRLVAALGTAGEILGDRARASTVVLRPLEPGDYGWVVHRHGLLYAQEYQWDESFEALVARTVADFIDEHRLEPRRVAAWIAEVEGQRAGCVFCTQKDRTTAQLRLLLVDPAARGAGIGGRLVDECVRFARRAGYEQMVLWTNDVLVDARRIYDRAGFTLVGDERHHSFGHDLVGQTFQLDLR
jgi:DNA-binding MarR family transcriptional regulator/N-acetylglutamate synthase-like GNAT family acetyltransferase